MTDSIQTIDDISALVEIKPSYTWIWIIILSITILALTVISLFFFFKNKSRLKKPLTALEVFNLKIKNLNPEIKAQKVKPFCFKLSLSLREYLSSTWNVEATESTSKEFLTLVKSISPQHLELFTHFCEVTDIAKFSKKTLAPKKMSEIWSQIQQTVIQINKEEKLKQQDLSKNV